MNISNIFRRMAAGALLSAVSMATAQMNTFMDVKPYTAVQGADITAGMVWDDLRGEPGSAQFMVVPGFAVRVGGENFDTLFIGQGMVTGSNHRSAFSLGICADLCDRGLGEGVHRSPIRVAVEGQPGNRVLRVEWCNAGFYEEWSYHGTLKDSLNLQVSFSESDGHSELAFGSGACHQKTGWKAGLLFQRRDTTAENWSYGCQYGFMVPDSLSRGGRKQLPAAGSTWTFSPEIPPGAEEVTLMRAKNGRVGALKAEKVMVFRPEGLMLQEMHTQRGELDVSGLNSGVYLLKMRENGGKLRVARLFVP